MKMFTVIFEKDGEPFATFTLHAADEIGARTGCDALFHDHPEYDPRRNEPDLTIRVEKAEPPFR